MCVITLNEDIINKTTRVPTSVSPKQADKLIVSTFPKDSTSPSQPNSHHLTHVIDVSAYLPAFCPKNNHGRHSKISCNYTIFGWYGWYIPYVDDMDNRLLVMKKTAPARVSPPFLVPSHACVRLPSPVVHKLPFVAVRPASLGEGELQWSSWHVFLLVKYVEIVHYEIVIHSSMFG